MKAMQLRSDARVLHFTTYNGDILQVWWRGSYSLREFPQDSVYQKLFKLVHFD